MYTFVKSCSCRLYNKYKIITTSEYSRSKSLNSVNTFQDLCYFLLPSIVCKGNIDFPDLYVLIFLRNEIPDSLHLTWHSLVIIFTL